MQGVHGVDYESIVVGSHSEKVVKVRPVDEFAQQGYGARITNHQRLSAGVAGVAEKVDDGVAKQAGTLS